MPSRARHSHDLFDNAGLLAGTIMAHPREFVAAIVAAVATLAIVVNALFLQQGPHPAPFFVPPPLTPLTQKEAALPRHRPAQAAPAEPVALARSQAQIAHDIQRELRQLGYYNGEIDGIWGIKTAAAARDFVRAARLTLKPEPSENLLQAATAISAKSASAQASSSEPATASLQDDKIAKMIAPSKRLAAIQRALAEFGYGQIKPTGVYDDATRMAVENFQRDHKLPADGQPSDRFARELATMTGRALEE